MVGSWWGLRGIGVGKVTAVQSTGKLRTGVQSPGSRAESETKKGM